MFSKDEIFMTRSSSATATAPNLPSSGTGTNVYYLALQNQTNGFMSSLYIGEKEAVKMVMGRQRKFLESIQGWYCDGDIDRGDTTLYLRTSAGGDIVMIMAMVELDDKAAQRYFELKQEALSKDLPFSGISSADAGKTDILKPIDPDTGVMYIVNNIGGKR